MRWSQGKQMAGAPEALQAEVLRDVDCFPGVVRPYASSEKGGLLRARKSSPGASRAQIQWLQTRWHSSAATTLNYESVRVLQETVSDLRHLVVHVWGHDYIYF